MNNIASYLDVFKNEVIGTCNWVWNQITFNIPWDENYFYGLIIISFFVWVLEILFPWRKDQSFIRKDFWMDGFYMFFNFFIFSIIISGFYAIIEKFSAGNGITMESIAILPKNLLPNSLFILLFFIISDFVQWITHVMLHRFSILWQFHKVHHSVLEMGFAAHLRYHWMENILYKPLKTFAVMILIGAEPEHAFFIHFFSILIGHLNHANIRITWGPFKYLINNPVMHLYHHAKELPKGQMHGVNFGLSLSIWDYIFKTNYIPQEKDGSFELGFDDIDEFPKTFLRQISYGFKRNKLK